MLVFMLVLMLMLVFEVEREVGKGGGEERRTKEGGIIRMRSRMRGKIYNVKEDC